MRVLLTFCSPGDYVLATNETHSVREFVEKAFAQVGVDIEWRGKGVEEVSAAGLFNPQLGGFGGKGNVSIGRKNFRRGKRRCT